MTMNLSVRDFLLRTQGKIVAHYQQVLRLPSIPDLERQTIRARLAQAEAELNSLGPREMDARVVNAA
jgi:hypothetical protein